MDFQTISDCYTRLKNLHLVASELNMKWQTVYWHLKKNGVSVTGDKARYGSDTDKLAAKGEAIFERIVPFATNNNTKEWQSPVDFDVRGIPVDVKTSRLAAANGKFQSKRWAFCLKKQQLLADFFVCFALDESEQSVAHILLIPGEMVIGLQTISLSMKQSGKWMKFKVSETDLLSFFEEMTV